MTSPQLKAWRERLGMKKTEAADQLGLSRNTYTAYETGRRIPRYVALACAALAYGLPPMGD